MKFFWCPRTRAFRIGWLLEELGKPYERIAVDIRAPEPSPDPDFRAASPMGKVPAISDGPVKLWDSGAIAVYLADAYPDAGLGVPVGAPERGAFLQWCLYTNSVIEPAMGEKFNGREPNKLQSGYGSFDLMIETLEKALASGPWIMGARFTTADALIGSSVYFMQTFKVLPENSTLVAYAERCRARPAFQRALSWDA